MKTILNLILLLVLSLVLVACGEPAAVEPTAEPLPVETEPAAEPVVGPDKEQEEVDMEEKEEMEREETAVPVPGELEELVEEMKADLSQRAGVETDAITVIKVEAVTWNDGSLGCPQPGQMYTMALEPGYRVILTAAGREFNYHTRATSYFVYCESPQAPLMPES
jgi:hypothetical protein